MTFKLLVFVIFCGILQKSNANDLLAHCKFSENDFEIDDFDIKERFYTCSLVTNIEYGNPNEINSTHDEKQNDSDVKLFTLSQGNALKKLSPLVCNKFQNLQAFWIEDAQIELVNKHTFENCEELKYLQLSSNKFSDLSEHLLQKNLNLEVIKITENDLKHLHERFFLNQLYLKHLDLHDNEFRSLPNKIFHSLTKLENLILWGNKIHSIKPEWFTTLQNLKTLDFELNEISILNTGMFETLVNLETVSLAQNQIAELPRDVFLSLTNVTHIALFQNSLNILHSDTFSALKKLTSLDVENNNIDAVDPKLIDDYELENFNMKKNTCANFKARLNSRLSRNFAKRRFELCIKNYEAIPFLESS